MDVSYGGWLLKYIYASDTIMVLVCFVVAVKYLKKYQEIKSKKDLTMGTLLIGLPVITIFISPAIMALPGLILLTPVLILIR